MRKKNFFIFEICTLLVLSLFVLPARADNFPTGPNNTPPVAFVYKGQGSCGEHNGNCSLAAANVAAKVGFRVVYVEPQDIERSNLAAGSVWIQPGGDALTVAKFVSREGMMALRNFVANGGHYLGFCAGAFFADTWIDDANTVAGLGLLPNNTTYDAEPTQKPMMMQVIWQQISRWMYFQGGAAFKPLPGITPIAYYANGNIAAMVSSFGKGRVALTGAHPEAPDSWAPADHLSDPDGSDMNFAIDLLHHLYE